MKVFLCFISVIALVSASQTIREQAWEQLPWKFLQWSSAGLLGLKDKTHYNTQFKLFNLPTNGVTSDWYNSKTYKTIRSFVGC